MTSIQATMTKTNYYIRAMAVLVESNKKRGVRFCSGLEDCPLLVMHSFFATGATLARGRVELPPRPQKQERIDRMSTETNYYYYHYLRAAFLNTFGSKKTPGSLIHQDCSSYEC
jgi:hypothetical protein